MKKLLTILFLAFFATINANVVTDLAKTANNIVDSTKVATVNAVKTVDTSSNFKMIYSDWKDGITALAASLKVGAEHVYVILVKQQIVNSISYLIIYILVAFLWYALVKNWKQISNDTDDLGNIFGGVVLSIVTVTLLAFTLKTTIMGFVNPEYGAIQDVIEFVKSTR